MGKLLTKIEGKWLQIEQRYCERSFVYELDIAVS